MNENVLVTGAAGFIGSHLCDRLLEEGRRVIGMDNLETGHLGNLEEARKNPQFTFVKGDCGLLPEATRALKECSEVYHLAASNDVRVGVSDPSKDFSSNVVTTKNLLEAVRQMRNSTSFVFSSSSTVYGEPSVIPTPETYGPLSPISPYGASKLSCEGWISAYSAMFGIEATIFRLANVVGPRLNHGVISDFVAKLTRDPARLEVLGNGSQAKSYISVEDCVDGFLAGSARNRTRFEIYNLGSDDSLDVSTIASIVEEEMNIMGKPHHIFKQTVADGRGWNGDVIRMQLDISKLKSIRWKPRMTSAEAVRETARRLLTLSA